VLALSGTLLAGIPAIQKEVQMQKQFISGPNWQVSASLPQALQVRLGSSVSIEMDTDKPYLHHEEHKRRYPPGHSKKGKKHKGGKKGKK
jgi:hypothetical protein